MINSALSEFILVYCVTPPIDDMFFCPRGVFGYLTYVYYVTVNTHISLWESGVGLATWWGINYISAIP